MPLEDSKHLLPDLVGNPGEKAMRDDVVKRPGGAVDVGNALLEDLNVAETEPRNHRLAAFGLTTGQLHTDEMTPRVEFGEWNQIASVGASQFQDATIPQRRRLKARGWSSHLMSAPPGGCRTSTSKTGCSTVGESA